MTRQKKLQNNGALKQHFYSLPEFQLLLLFHKNLRIDVVRQLSSLSEALPGEWETATDEADAAIRVFVAHFLYFFSQRRWGLKLATAINNASRAAMLGLVKRRRRRWGAQNMLDRVIKIRVFIWRPALFIPFLSPSPLSLRHRHRMVRVAFKSVAISYEKQFALLLIGCLVFASFSSMACLSNGNKLYKP